MSNGVRSRTVTSPQIPTTRTTTKELETRQTQQPTTQPKNDVKGDGSGFNSASDPTSTSTTTKPPSPTTTPTDTDTDTEDAAPKNHGQARAALAHSMNSLRHALKFASHKGNPNVAQGSDAQIRDAITNLAKALGIDLGDISKLSGPDALSLLASKLGISTSTTGTTGTSASGDKTSGSSTSASGDKTSTSTSSSASGDKTSTSSGSGTTMSTQAMMSLFQQILQKAYAMEQKPTSSATKTN